MTLVASSTHAHGVNGGMRLEPRCACPQYNGLPLRVQVPGLVELHAIVKASPILPASDAVLLTYYCADCRTKVPLTLRDLYLMD